MTESNKAYQSGVRFRAYPDAALAALLRQWIGCQRVIYNGKVEEDKLFAAQRRLQLRSGDPNIVTPLDQQYAQFKDKELTPWLSEVPSQLLRNGAVRWMAAKQRQLKGLANAPRLRNRSTFNTVLVTSELFRLKRVQDAKGRAETIIELGTEKRPVGTVPFKAHRPYQLPNQLVLRVEGSNQWFVSFSYEHESTVILREPHELAYELGNLDSSELQQLTTGLDRNVKDNCIASSEGKLFRIPSIVEQRIRKKEARCRRFQRRLARCKKSSSNRRKLAQKIAGQKVYARRAREDFSHKVSYTLANSASRFFVLEALNIAGMTRKAKAKQDPVTGKWLPNGRGAKAGLNSAILRSCWGLININIKYKAARANKLVGAVPAAYTSQECSRCGHTHPDNRHEQRFVCQRCGFEDHADINAACVIKRRGLTLLSEGVYEKTKPKKRVAFQRKNSKEIKTTGGLPGLVCGANVRPNGSDISPH